MDKESAANLLNAYRAGIMVTHDLRMCEYVDWELQMQDGKLVKEYTSRGEIMTLVKGGNAG